MGKHHARNGYLENDDNFYFKARAIPVVELLQHALDEGRPIRLLWPEDQLEDTVQTEVMHFPENWNE